MIPPNKFEYFALDRYCQIRGYNRGISFGCPDTSGLHAHDENWVCYSLPIIDHPFCHEIIKGLDANKGGSVTTELGCEYYKFKTALRDIIYSGLHEQGVESLSTPESEQLMFTADPPQILEAIYKALHEEEK